MAVRTGRPRTILVLALVIFLTGWLGLAIVRFSPASPSSTSAARLSQGKEINLLGQGFHKHPHNDKDKHGELEPPAAAVDQCNVGCKTGIPCEYASQVDFRLMVITFNRSYSLQKTLTSLYALDTLGDMVAVEIWIDRNVRGLVDDRTVEMANNFTRNWTKGRACVHVQEKNANIRGQWIDIWRPRENTKEIGLIVEDDIDLSPYVYRWLKAVHGKYKTRDDVTGYTLQMENVKFKSGSQKVMAAPKTEKAFMYPVTGTWGFSPHPLRWREFQDWFHVTVKNETFHPYVPGIISTQWYKISEKKGIADRVWAMWHHYFNYHKHLYCVYCNLKAFTGKGNVLLSANRMESGLHFSHSSNQKAPKSLLQTWNDSYSDLQETTIQFNYDGSIARRV